MKNLNYQLSARLKNVLSPDNGSGMARERTGNASTKLLAVLTTFLMLFILGVGNTWGAEDDTHDFSQSLQQLLNDNASIAGINIAKQSYPIKEVIISFRYNKTITNAVTMEVKVGGASWGTKNSEGTGSNYKTRSFTHDAVTGAVSITFTNNTGTGTGHGTFYVNKVTLVEGAPSDPCTVTLMDDTEHPITETSAGAGVTLPSRAGCTGYTFAGWTASWTEEQDEWTTTAPSIIEAGAYSPSGDVNLYPVYTKTSGGGSSTVTFTPGTDTGTNSVTKSVVTCTMSKMNNASYYQIYADASGTFSVSSGNITAISFTCTNSNTEKYGPGNANANVGTYSYDGYVGSWSGSANSVTISASKQVRMEALSVTCTQPSTTSYISVPNCCTQLGTINGSVTLTQDGTSVTVKGWTYTQGSGAAESSIDYYTVNLYASTDSYASVVKTGTCEYDEKSTGVTLTGLTYGVTYKIKISATGNTGYCPISETLVENINSTATETFQLACDVPTNVTASAQTSDGATLSWDDVATNYEYVVDQSSSNPAGSGTAVNGAHSVTLTGLEASTLYYFHVRTNCGNSVYSNWATASFSTTSAAYFPQNKTLWFEAKTQSESAWKDDAKCKAWFRDCDSDCGEAPWTYWQADGDSYKKYYAVVIPSTGNYPYVTVQRYNNYEAQTLWGIGGAQTYSTGGGSNVIKSTCATDGCLSWSATTLRLYLRGDILVTNGNWESNIGEMIDQNGGVWSYTHSNYAPTATSLDFKLYTNYNFWIGNTTSNNNATLSDLVVGSTYNITATYNVNTHALVMSKTPVNYQVHFDMNDHGSAISSYTTVTPNSTISAPSDPSESGWTFGGWYTDDACTTGNEWDFANDPVTETMTLHAKWTRTPIIKLNDATENITVAFSDKAVDATTGYMLSFTVSGQYLTENIAIGKSGTDQAMFTVSPSTVTQSEGTAASTTINVTYKPSTIGSHSATLTLSSAGAVDRTVTLSGTAKWKVVWKTNGGEYTTTLVDNNTKPTFPDPAPTSCESGDGASTTFIGWTKQKWTGKKNQAYIDALTGNDVVHVANTTMANVTDNTTEYHAVYALASGSGSATYKKVTSGLSDYSGQYLIVFETDNICFDGSRSTGQSNTNLDASGNFRSVEISTTSNPYSIASTSTIDTYSFTISASQTSGKYYIQSASGYYIGSTNADDTGSNELLISTSTTYDNSISVSSGNATITGVNNILKCFKQSGQSDRFRYFKTTAGNVNPIQLYKYDPGITYSNYMTTCCENNVTLADGSPSHGTITFDPAGPVETCSGSKNVTMTITPDAGYYLSDYDHSGVSTSNSPTIATSGSTSQAAQDITLTFAQNTTSGTYTADATFSPILVSSLTLRAQQTGQDDKVGSDLTMTCYPKEGQTGGNDPLNHSLNVKFHEVLPANALDKEYDWSVRVKATGAADWTNVGFTGNALNTNNIINSYNKSTGNLQIKATTGTAEIKITAHDGSGVTAKVTITVANVSVSSISVDPTSMDVYAGQKKPVTITFSPDNATDKAYTTGSYTYVTMRSSGSNPFYIEGNATNVVRNETVTVTSHDGSKTATIDVTVNPLPKATFIDIVHGKTDFLVEGESVLVDGTLTATVVNEGLDVDTEWHTPTHVDVADPGDGHNTCERQHLHLVGWILKDWADLHPDATHSEIVTAGATNFYVPNAALDLSSASVNGKTYYAVWAKVVTP